MGLVNISNNRIFLGIQKGKITRKVQGQDEPEKFDAIEGVLKQVVIRSVDIQGQPTEFVDLVIEDGGDTFDLSTQLAGGIARSIILALASVTSFVGAKVRINPYLSRDGEHTNVAVRVNGQKVGWVVEPNQLPPLERVKVGSKEVIDDTARVEFTKQLLATIAERVKAAAATPQAAIADSEDLPAGDENPEGGFFAGGEEHI